ncbi:MAG: DUF3794 domain-containing protein [Firmicutes bacterium]|nr:DUF3794 domain-containing protein [Bacillota bacterium]
MKYYFNSTNPQQLNLKTKRLKVLKVIGKKASQLVLKSATCLNAIKIDRIKAKLLKATSHVLANKVVTEGIIRKEIFYVDPHNYLRFTTEDLPFVLKTDLPGVKPDPLNEIQTHLEAIDVSYTLHPARGCLPGCLRQVVTAKLLVVVARWSQVDVVTKAKLSPSHCIASPVYRSNYAFNGY